MIALTFFDIIAASIILASSLLGLYRGFVHIAVNFVGFVASVFVAILFYPYVKIIFNGQIENELGILILSGAIAYILSLVIFTFLASKLLLLLSECRGGIFDRILGLFLGFIRGVVFVIIIFIVIAIFSTGVYLKESNLYEAISNLNKKEYPSWLKESEYADHYDYISKEGAFLIPSELLQSIKMPGADKDKKQNPDDDIIDSINRKKEGVKDSISIQIDEDLERDLKDLGL